MPSAAISVKVEKQISQTENALSASADGNSTISPLRQAITIIEHKIRNLEKRKSKLESYKELQNSGKELNSDQKTALAKIDEVVMTLDFARDLYKQFLGIVSSSEKDAKKLAKREASLKSQAELARLREILLVQDALLQMGGDNVRDDFLNGRNGAAQLTELDLKLLDDLYPAVTPKHHAGNPTGFTNEVQTAAEHLLAVVDGKSKEIFGGSYSQVKEILGKIHESGYFDQAQESLEENVELGEADDSSSSLPPPPQSAAAAIEQQVEINQIPKNDVNLPAPIESLTIEASNQRPPLAAIHNVIPIEQTTHILPANLQIPQQLIMDPAIAAVSTHQQKQPPQLPPTTNNDLFYQSPRPITEMLGPGSFFFIQDSELDTPDQIPTQTFTNQTFVGQPPSLIPLPVHFQPQQISPNGGGGGGGGVVGNLPSQINPQLAANNGAGTGTAGSSVLVPSQIVHVPSNNHNKKEPELLPSSVNNNKGGHNNGGNVDGRVLVTQQHQNHRVPSQQAQHNNNNNNNHHHHHHQSYYNNNSNNNGYSSTNNRGGNRIGGPSSTSSQQHSRNNNTNNNNNNGLAASHQGRAQTNRH